MLITAYGVRPRREAAMTSLIQWFTGDGQPAAPIDDEPSIDILAENREALPAHVQEFLDQKAAAGF
jgi:hypothetical protein